MQNPLVSIIIPTFNRAHLVGETLDSVQKQTYVNWECIVVDDGSTDTTAAIVDAYVQSDIRFRYVSRPQNLPKGANACRNYGFELCKGEYVNWFDDDDVMHKDKLLKQSKVLIERNINFSVCQTLIFENNINNIIGLRSENIYSENTFHDYLKQNIVWMTPSALWKKSFLNSLSNLFDVELQAAQEWEFHCRVLFECRTYHCIDEALVFIRRHDESISSNKNIQNRKFNYFLARLKVLLVIQSEEKYIKSSIYLKTYVLNYLKNSIRNKQFKITLNVYKKLKVNGFSLSYTSKIAIVASIISFKVFNKGEIFLKKIAF